MSETIGIVLLVVLSICFGACGGAAWMAHRKDKERQIAIEDLVFKARIGGDLDVKEKTMIKERRLMAHGYKYCEGACKRTYFVSRVSGMRYKYPDGSIKAITLRKVPTKEGEKLICEDCLKAVEASRKETI